MPRNRVTTLRCRCRRIDREVDGVAAGSADEARERAADEKEERHHVHRVAHPRGDEAVERHRHPAGHERDDPGDEHGQQREHAPEDEPDQVRDREEEPEEDGEPRPLEVVGQLEPNRVRRQRGVRDDAGRVGGRVAVGDEEQVAGDLRRVPDRVHRPGHAARAAFARERTTRTTRGRQPLPRARRSTSRSTSRRRVSSEATHDVFTNHDPPPTAAASMSTGTASKSRAATRPRDWRVEGVDLDVDRVALAAAERRIRAGGEIEVGADVDGVAQVRDDESLQRARRLPLEDEREPDDHRDGGCGKAPQRDHDQVGDREQKAEEHRDARALEIVGDDDLDRQATTRVVCFCCVRSLA